MSRIFPAAAVFTAALSTTLLGTLPATAADGLYAGAGLGLVKGPSTTASGTSGGTVKFDTGNMGVAFIGSGFQGGDIAWRGEAEISRRALDLSSVSGTSARGEVLATSLMGNAIYDFETVGPVRPYIGAGVGLAKVELNGAAPFGGSTVNGSDTTAALQLLAGLSYSLNDQVDLFTDYRYFATRNADFTTAAGTATSMDLSTHGVMAGLRFNFGTSTELSNAELGAGALGSEMQSMTTAAAGPSEVQTSQDDQLATLPQHTLPDTYMVHFVLNKAIVTEQGLDIIDQAAANARAMSVTRLILTGHTDRSGDEGYNVDLSKRRAEAVKAAFVARGFDADEISVKAKGETALLVPTDDGKYEPKNRRVEIVLP
ncbi:OmpA family protein [Magnetovibrio sp.]|uniref:OmpA family protein n=1 Tax=Magnetovibrio sp. TaxID=2024836 RepID=UPI002F939D24